VKVRSLNELEDLIDKDLSWRKREYTTLKFMVDKSRNHEKEVLVRASITMLYAHWEGHIKLCSQAYLSYLCCLAPKYSDMSDNFVQISLGDRFKSGFSIKKFKSQKEIFDYLMGELNESFLVDPKKIVDTESNLKYEVLSNLMRQLGLNHSEYELKENFIDSKLLDCRNAIAHGEKKDMEHVMDTYFELMKEILFMIINYGDMIKSAAENKSFLKDAA